MAIMTYRHVTTSDPRWDFDAPDRDNWAHAARVYDRMVAAHALLGRCSRDPTEQAERAKTRAYYDQLRTVAYRMLVRTNTGRQ